MSQFFPTLLSRKSLRPLDIYVRQPKRKETKIETDKIKGKETKIETNKTKEKETKIETDEQR